MKIGADYVGDRIRIYTPNCRIKTMHNTNNAVIIGVHPSFEQAQLACDKCKVAINDMCPVVEPRIIVFVIEDQDQ